MSVSSELSKARARFGWAMSKQDFDDFVDELEGSGVTPEDMVAALAKTAAHASNGYKVTLDTLLASACRIASERKEQRRPTPASRQLSDDKGKVLDDEESLTRVQGILDMLRKT